MSGAGYDVEKLSQPVPYSQLHEHSRGKEDDSQAILLAFAELDSLEWDSRCDKFLAYRSFVLEINQKNQAIDRQAFAAMQEDLSQSFDPDEISRDSDGSELAFSHSRVKPRGKPVERKTAPRIGGKGKPSKTNGASHLSKFSSV
eukprot:gene42066-51356_t